VRGTQLGDCDDYARKLVDVALDDARAKGDKWVPAVGWYRYRDLETNHAANLFIDGDRTVWLIEPQDGKVTRPGYEEGMYINWYGF
jgi:hypothetical protein